MITQEIGEGRPLVLIHGFGVDSRILRTLENIVDFSGWRRIYLDLPWTSRGLNPAATSATAVLHLAEKEIQAHLGNEGYALIGNSFGAMIARSLAHRHTTLGLATLAGVFEPDAQKRNLPEKTVLFTEPSTTDSSLLVAPQDHQDEFTDISVIHNEQNFQRFHQHVLPGILEADPGIMQEIATRYVIEPVPEEAATEPYSAPSLHIFGRQDHIVGFKDGLAWLDHYTRGTFAVLDTAGHNLHLEQPQLVKALLENWLARLANQPERF